MNTPQITGCEASSCCFVQSSIACAWAPLVLEGNHWVWSFSAPAVWSGRCGRGQALGCRWGAPRGVEGEGLGSSFSARAQVGEGLAWPWLGPCETSRDLAPPAARRRFLPIVSTLGLARVLLLSGSSSWPPSCACARDACGGGGGGTLAAVLQGNEERGPCGRRRWQAWEGGSPP
jgi:hypothetical protein